MRGTIGSAKVSALSRVEHASTIVTPVKCREAIEPEGQRPTTLFIGCAIIHLYVSVLRVAIPFPGVNPISVEFLRITWELTLHPARMNSHGTSVRVALALELSNEQFLQLAVLKLGPNFEEGI